jgi:hypothetical protein
MIAKDFDQSVQGARDAAERDELDKWVAAFLVSDGSDNAELAAALQAEMRFWHGPVMLPFKQLHRLAGPVNEPTLARFDEDDVDRVEAMEDSVEEGWEPPPLIVSLEKSHLVVEDGNHRIEGLRRLGRREYWSVVGFRNAQERDLFLADWGEG